MESCHHIFYRLKNYLSLKFLLLGTVITIVLYCIVGFYGQLVLGITVSPISTPGLVQIYYDTGQGYNPLNYLTKIVKRDSFVSIPFPSKNINRIRIDVGFPLSSSVVRNITLTYLGKDYQPAVKLTNNRNRSSIYHDYYADRVQEQMRGHVYYDLMVPQEIISNRFVSIITNLLLIVLIIFFVLIAFDQSLPDLLKNLWPGTFILVGLIPIGVYFYFIMSYSMNIPMFVDLASIFPFMNDHVEKVSRTFPSLLSPLFQLQGSPGWFYHFTYIVCYFFLGRVDFYLINIFGNLGLLMICFLLIKSVKVKTAKLYYYLPIIFLLFQMEYFALSWVSIYSVPMLWTILFVLVAINFMNIYIFNRDLKYYYLSILFAFIAMISFINGFLATILSFFMLLQKKARAYKFAIMYIIIICVFSVTYYYHGITNNAYEISLSKNIFAQLFYNPFKYIQRLLLTLGTNSITKANLWLAYFTGLVAILGLWKLIKCGYYKINSTVFYFILFLFVTILLVIIGRNEMGQSEFSIHYRIYFSLIAVCFYIAFLDLYHGKGKANIVLVILFFSVLFNIFSYKNNVGLLKVNKDIYNYRLYFYRNIDYTESSKAINGPGPSVLNSIYAKSERLGYYKWPSVKY